MRFMVAIAVVSSLLLPLAGPADAQTRLPRTSPAERQTKEINRRIQQEQRLLNLEQQIQNENNHLRRRIDRQRLFSNPSPSVRVGRCPPGAIRC
ncbi:hypothetical protein JKG68_04090 [Microvirga aerilata]|jgi:TolA-binding protein|uniref:YbgF trimerisation domain-containing protein n=1 Tax=Microvirga aerilata TaxID=670292 RepID=A0A936ZAE3_9HYPH|nr:hypothetical protein [Microvirga aerilata]MBL0403137.1 hypothetical protein [Microvirga aerilata]